MYDDREWSGLGSQIKERWQEAAELCALAEQREQATIGPAQQQGHFLSLNFIARSIGDHLSRSMEIVLDTFFVNDAKTGNLAGPEQRDKFEAILNKALTGEEVDFQSLIAKQKITRPLYHAYTGERIATQVRFDNEASETRTLIEIENEDRIGLLYMISQTLSELDLDISAAKISTEKGAAIDSFYVREMDGTKVLAPERQRAIERKLRHAIHELDSR